MHVTNIQILLNIILEQYILPTRCITLITDGTSTINSATKGVPTVNVNLDTNDDSLTLDKKLFQNYGCQIFLLSVSEPAETFSKIEQLVKYQNETLMHRKYIVISDSGTAEKSLNIFRTREIDFVCDVLIISSEGIHRSTTKGKSKILDQSTEEFNLRTHQFVGLNRNKVVLLDKWFSANRSFYFNANLFPDKLYNQQGRQTKIGFFHYEPYVLIRRNQTTETTTINGVEGELLNIFFKQHNIGKKYVLIRNEYWGDVFDNGTVYGLRGDVYNEKVDIGIAANFATDRMYRYFGLSAPSLRVGVTCLVPAPKLAARWLTPTYVYTSKSWEAIFFAHTLLVVSIFYLEVIIKQNRLRHLGKSRYGALIKALGKLFFDDVKQLFNQGLSKCELHQGLTGTIFAVTAILSTFFLARIYESGLSTVMTIPLYAGSIKTRDDFLRSNLTFGGIQVADWINNWKNDKETLYRKARERYTAASSAKELRKMLDAGNFCLLIERLPYHKYHFPFRSLENSEDIHLMKEDLHWEFTVFLLRKSSVLLPSLNEFVDHMNEAGIIYHLLNQAIGFSMHQTSQGIIHYNANAASGIKKKAVQLQLSHVAGAFGIIFLGNFFALLMFIAELIHYSKYKNAAT